MTLDPLTGLALKSGCLERGEARVVEGAPFLLALFNLDQFKRFNLHNGHGAGDEVLRAIAAQLRDREAFRIGGDTFAVFLDDGADAERIRARVASSVNPAQPAHCGDQHCMGPAPAPRLSAGLCAWRGEPFAELLARAEAALERAKCSGRDRVEQG